ncbi:MAG: hypothetical protein II278_09860 [Bacteroidaceae bacterium]|nr:hypothetical protein [Bacteroidaceae bacterium]
MKTIKSIIAVAIWGLASAATAQNLNSGYFTDGYLYRHTLNPAFGNDQSYVAMPALGNLNVGMNSNLRVDDILFNVNGRTALFLNPQVSTSEFLDGIHDKNKITENLRLQILGTGFKAFGGYNTFEINARQDLGLNIPGSLFRLAKEGIENKTYDISNFNAHADGYAEIALGHSRQINDQLRVGAKLKVLLGIANIDANFKKAQLTLGENEWIGITDAEIQASIKSMKYEIEETERGPEGEETTHKYVSGLDIDSWGINGFGLAFDLGAEYKLDKNWAFSASLLDLGYIGWNNNYVASTNGERQINTDKYIFNVDEDASNSFENEADRLMEGLSALYELQDNGDMGSRSKALAATMNLGVQYTPDFYDKLSFGLLNSTRMAGKYSWTEFRLSANVAPTNIFSASANMALGTYGTSFGWLLNFHPSGFNLFVGMDHTLGKLAKQGVPLSGRANVNIGINFPFGR